MVGFNYKIFCVIPVDGVFNWCKSPLPGVKKKSNRFFFAITRPPCWELMNIKQ